MWVGGASGRTGSGWLTLMNVSRLSKLNGKLTQLQPTGSGSALPLPLTHTQQTANEMETVYRKTLMNRIVHSVSSSTQQQLPPSPPCLCLAPSRQSLGLGLVSISDASGAASIAGHLWGLSVLVIVQLLRCCGRFEVNDCPTSKWGMPHTCVCVCVSCVWHSM